VTARTPPLLIVVTGPPGSGKSTIADRVRARTGLPLVAKDSIKELLGEELDVTTATDSKRLGSAVFRLMGDLMRELLEHGVSLVIEGNFAVGYPLFDDLPPARVIQVHVGAPREVLLERMRTRDAERHPVHYDAEAMDEITARLDRGEWEPLPLEGELIRIDTSGGASVEELVDDALAPLLRR
jgi:predicted kinase